MPSGLRRFHESGQTHFVTFCCYRRRESLSHAFAKETFEAALERVRITCDLCVYGYVVMPEHVHLLVSEPQRATLADAIKSLKQGVSRRLIGGAEHFWQKRYYDFNLRDYKQFVEKLRYIHRNPVKRGLCAHPEDWEWSSFLHYSTGQAGRVEIESEWTARIRECAVGRLCAKLPHSSQKQLEWATRPATLRHGVRQIKIDAAVATGIARDRKEIGVLNVYSAIQSVRHRIVFRHIDVGYSCGWNMHRKTPRTLW